MYLNGDALGALVSDTAILLNSGAFGTGLTASFLCKQVQYNFQATAGTSGDGCIFGICNGTATVAEVAAALHDRVLDPNDGGSPAIAAQKAIIWWETLVYVGVGTEGEEPVNKTISVGGGKGIPMTEENGIAFFVWNPSLNALITGGVVEGLITFKGVWLGA